MTTAYRPYIECPPSRGDAARCSPRFCLSLYRLVTLCPLSPGSDYCTDWMELSYMVSCEVRIAPWKAGDIDKPGCRFFLVMPKKCIDCIRNVYNSVVTM